MHVKHTCELIFQPSIVGKCIYTDVLTILLFQTNWSFKGGGSVVVDSLLIPLWGSVFVPFKFCDHLDGEERAGCFTLSFWCLVDLPHGAVGWSAVCDCGIF